MNKTFSSNTNMSDLFLPRNLWVPNDNVTACFSCKAAFGILFTRRHHCRVCGNIFCSKCSDHFLNSQEFKFENETAIRVCKHCFETTIRNALAKVSEINPNGLKIRPHSSETKELAEISLSQIMSSFIDALFNETLKTSFIISELPEFWQQILNELIFDYLSQFKTEESSRNRPIQAIKAVKVKKIPYEDTSKSRSWKGLMIRKPVSCNIQAEEMENPRVLIFSTVFESDYGIAGVVSLMIDLQQDSDNRFIKNIRALRPNLIISQHPIKQKIQSMLLKDNIYVICQPRQKQFDRIVRFFEAKVIKKLSQLEEQDSSIIGTCSKIKLIQFNNENYYKDAAKDDAKCSTLIHFSHKDSTCLARTIIVSGPDYNELKKAKEYVTNCLNRWVEMLLEKELTLHEIYLYFGTKRTQEAIKAVSAGVIEFDTAALMIRCKEFFGDNLIKAAASSVSEFPNTISIQSVGYLCGFFLNELKPVVSLENRSMQYAKLNLVNVNHFDFDRIRAEDYLNFSKSLQKHKSKKLDAIAQICGRPTIKSSEFYGEGDISLENFLRKKSEMVIEECTECGRPRYYHTSFCYSNRVCVKISTQVIGSIKEARIKETLKKYDLRPDGQVDDLKYTAFPEENKLSAQQNLIPELNEGSTSRKGTAPSLQIKDKDKILSALGGAVSKKAPKGPIKMYIECNDCHSKITDEVELRGSYTEYSFCKYLEELFTICDKFNVVDPKSMGQSRMKDTVEPAGPRGSYSSTLVSMDPRVLRFNKCCLLSCKSRVFNCDDEVLIKFTCVPARMYQWASPDIRDPQIRKITEKLNKKRVNWLLFAYSSGFKSYLNEITGFFDKFILELEPQAKENLCNLEFEEILENKALVFDNPNITSLLMQLVLIKSKLQALKIACDVEFAKEFSYFLQVEKIRRKIFDETIACCEKLYGILIEFKRLLRTKDSSPDSFDSMGSFFKGGSPSEKSEYLEESIYKSTSSQMMQSSDAVMLKKQHSESRQKEDEEVKSFVFNHEKGRVMSSFMSLFVQPASMKPKKSSLIKLRIKDPNSDLEKTVFENVIQGISGPEENLMKPSLSFFPISNKYPLSPIAFALNHPQYLDELGLITGDEFEKFANSQSLSPQIREKLFFVEGEHLAQIVLQSNPSNIYYPGFNQVLKQIAELLTPQKSSMNKRNLELQDLCLTVISGVKFDVSVLYPLQFHILRSLYGVKHQEFIQSLALSEVWEDNTGGKSKAKFVRSFDNMYVFKTISQAEFNALEELIPDYLNHIASLNIHTTMIAKILGVYKIYFKESGKYVYYLGMENVLLGLEPSRIYDLKGSEANRYIQDPKGGQVRLDSNFKIDQNGEPIEIDANRMNSLMNIISNDARFLSGHRRIDYSLILVLDDKNMRFRVSIIDYLVGYTIDRKLESIGKTIVKKAAPTIVDPVTYMKRFLLSIQRYFVGIPSNYGQAP